MRIIFTPDMSTYFCFNDFAPKCMKRDKKRDDHFFSCQAEHEIAYVTGLYQDPKKVREFLRENCPGSIIRYLTHMVLYKLIEKDLGYKIPE